MLSIVRRPLSRQFNFFFLSFSYLGGCFEDLEGEVLAGETAAAAATDGEGTERALRGRGGEAARRIQGWKIECETSSSSVKNRLLKFFTFLFLSWPKESALFAFVCVLLRLCFTKFEDARRRVPIRLKHTTERTLEPSAEDDGRRGGECSRCCGIDDGCR